MKAIIALLLWLLALPAAADVAINAGGGAIDSYLRDRYYVGGNTRSFDEQVGVYKTERRSRSRFSYAIPVTPGIVEVTLRLRESCVGCSPRTFKVRAEGKTVYPQITIPVNSIGDRTFSVQSGAKLNLEFTALSGEAFVNAIEVRELGAIAPVVNLTANPSSLAMGGSSVLSWSSTGATGCSASGGWTGAKSVSGSEATAPLSSSSTFTLVCSGLGGTTTQSTSVVVSAAAAPTVSLTASPATVASGGSATLTWTSSNATSCNATGAWSGAKTTSGSQSVGPLSANSTFGLTCSNASGSGSATTTVSLGNPPPTVSLSANPSTVASGGTSVLTWTSSNATSCNATGAWSGAKTTSGSQSVGPLSASSTFGLTCSNASGSGSASTTVSLGNPAPTVSVSALPTSVASGGASTISWNASNATSCSATGAWSGTKAISGTESTGALAATSTYTLNCTGPGGSTSRSVTVAVNGQRSYSTEFPLTENPISEGGEWRRANNAWTNVRTQNGVAHGTNGVANSYDDSYALLSGFGANQQIEATVFRSADLVTGITHEVELLLRFSDDANNARGYECLFNYAGGVQIFRWNGAMGDFTALPFTAGAGGLFRDLVSGDVIKATIVGNVISVFINGTLIAQTIDSAIPSGQPGISFFTRPGGNSAHFGLTSVRAIDLP